MIESDKEPEVAQENISNTNKDNTEWAITLKCSHNYCTECLQNKIITADGNTPIVYNN